jgi:hypothetical protein
MTSSYREKSESRTGFAKSDVAITLNAGLASEENNNNNNENNNKNEMVAHRSYADVVNSTVSNAATQTEVNAIILSTDSRSHGSNIAYDDWDDPVALYTAVHNDGYFLEVPTSRTGKKKFRGSWQYVISQLPDGIEELVEFVSDLVHPRLVLKGLNFYRKEQKYEFMSQQKIHDLPQSSAAILRELILVDEEDPHFDEYRHLYIQFGSQGRYLEALDLASSFRDRLSDLSIDAIESDVELEAHNGDGLIEALASPLVGLIRPIVDAESDRVMNNMIPRMKREGEEYVAQRLQAGVKSMHEGLTNVLSYSRIDPRPVHEILIDRMIDAIAYVVAVQDSKTWYGVWSVTLLYYRSWKCENPAVWAMTTLKALLGMDSLDALKQFVNGESSSLLDASSRSYDEFDHPLSPIEAHSADDIWNSMKPQLPADGIFDLSKVLKLPILKEVGKLIQILLAVNVCNLSLGSALARFPNIKPKTWVAEDLFGTIVEVVEFFFTKAVDVFTAGDLSILFRSDDHLGDLENRFVSACEASEAVCSHNMKRAVSLGFNTDVDVISEIEKLRVEVGNLVRVETNKVRQGLLGKKLAMIEKQKTALMKHQANPPLREAPFAIELFGGSGVGKSFINDLVAMQAAGAGGFPCGVENMIKIKPESEFQDTVNGSHTVITLDDFGNAKPEMIQVSPTNILIDLVNNAQAPINKANVEEKGKYYYNPKVLMVNTNVKDLSAPKFTMCVESILRRFNLVITVRWKKSVTGEDGMLKKEFRRNKDSAQIADLWDLIVEEPCIRRDPGGVSTRDVVEYKNVFRTNDNPEGIVNVYDMLEYVRISALEHFQEQRDSVARQMQTLQTGVCEHCSRVIPLCNHFGNCKGCEERKIPDDIESPVEKEKMDFLCSRLLKRKRKADEDTRKVHFSNTEFGTTLGSQQVPVAICDQELIDIMNDLNITTDVSKKECKPFSEIKSMISNVLTSQTTHIALGIGITAVSVVKLCQVIRMFMSSKLVNHSDSETSGDVAEARIPQVSTFEVKKPDTWRYIDTEPMAVSVESASTTLSNMMSVIHGAVAWFQVARETAPTGWSSAMAVPMKGDIWLAPNHLFYHDGKWIGDSRVQLKRTIRQSDRDVTSDLEFVLTEDIVHTIPKHDFALIRITGGGSVKPLCKWLLQSDPLPDMQVNVMVRRTNNLFVHTGAITGRPKWCTVEEGHSFRGFSYETQQESFKGMCCAPVISIGPKPAIVGFHLAGEIDFKRRCRGGILLRSDFDKAYEDMCGGANFIAHSAGTLNLERMGKIPTVKPKMEDRHPLRHLPPEMEPTVLNYGSTGVRNDFKSTVRNREISPSVAEVMDLPRQHGRPGEALPNGKVNIRKTLLSDLAVRACPLQVKERKLLKRAIKSLKRKYGKLFTENDKQYVCKLDHAAVLAGVDNLPGVNRMNLNSSTGWPICKPKRDFITPSEEQIEGINSPLEIDEKLMEFVEQQRDILAKDERCYAVFNTAYKDEVRPLEKDKVRLFSSCDFPTIYLVRQYFLTTLSWMRQHMNELEGCVGINPHGIEWTHLAERLRKHSNYFAGDFSSYDKWPGTEYLSACAEVVMEIPRLAGENFGPEDFRIMRGLLTEITQPLSVYDGSLIQFFGSNPSGHPMTVIFNDILQQLLMRMVFYSIYPEKSFSENVELATYGDDGIGCVSDRCPRFNQYTISAKLAEWRIKWGPTTKGQDFESEYTPWEELSFLKRNFVWNEELQRYMAPIELASISKALHCRVVAKKNDIGDCASTLQCVYGANLEFFHYGREEYYRRQEQLREVLSRHKNSEVEGFNGEPVQVQTYASYLRPFPTYEQVAKADIQVEEDYRGYQLTMVGFAAEYEHLEAHSEIVVSKDEDQVLTTDTGSALLGETGDMTRFDIRSNPNPLPMGEFFSRRTPLTTFNWFVGAEEDSTFKVHELFWDIPEFREKISHYNLIRYDMEITVEIVATPYHYGCLLVAYEPYGANSAVTATGLSTHGKLYTIQCSQMLHAYARPQDSQGAILKIPFICQEEYLNVPGKSWRNPHLGLLRVVSVNPLQHATGGSDPISVVISAKLDNVEYHITTYSALEAQSGDEYVGSVSKVASIVAGASKSLMRIPIIAPYARASMLVSSAISNVAAALGFSSPVIVSEQSLVTPISGPRMANANVSVPAVKLSLDCKQEVTVDPRVRDAGGLDEMAFGHIIGKESLLTTFEWQETDSAGDMLGSLAVTPNNWLSDNQSGADLTTPIGMLLSMFDKWQGNMIYRFEIISSRFHQGRIRIVHEPRFLPLTMTEWHKNTSYMCDLQGNTNFEIKVGPCNQYGILRAGTPAPNVDTFPVTLSPNKHNGGLGIYVVNRLTSPGPGSVEKVYINVYVRGDPDAFVFVGPRSDAIQDMSLTPPADPALEAQADGLTDPTGKAQLVATFGMAISSYDHLLAVYAGEEITSLRVIVKRICTHSYVVTDSPTAALWIVANNDYPRFRGSIPDAIETRNGQPYNYCHNIPLTYIAACYLGYSGGIRNGYVPMFRCDNASAQSRSSASLLRRNGSLQESISNTAITADPDTVKNLMTGLNGDWNGGYYQDIHSNQAVIGEMPYYREYKFNRLRHIRFSSNNSPCASHWLRWIDLSNGQPQIYARIVGAGDDFSLIHFVCVPLIFNDPL